MENMQEVHTRDREIQWNDRPTTIRGGNLVGGLFVDRTWYDLILRPGKRLLVFEGRSMDTEPIFKGKVRYGVTQGSEQDFRTSVETVVDSWLRGNLVKKYMGKAYGHSEEVRWSPKILEGYIDGCVKDVMAGRDPSYALDALVEAFK